MLEKVKINNVYYYVLPRGQRLFKGLSDTSRITNIGAYEWYGLNIETAETYGHIYVYSNIKPLNLFAMDERDNIELLMRNARLQERNDVIEALKETFMLYDEQPNVVIRNSEPGYDNTVVEFLCKNGYEGYGSDEMPKALNSDNFFHSEICVCKANEIIVYGNEKILTEKAKTSFTDRQRLGKKRPRIMEETDHVSPVVRDLFGNFQSPRSVSRGLFIEQDQQEEQQQEERITGRRALFMEQEQEQDQEQEQQEEIMSGRRALFMEEQEQTGAGAEPDAEAGAEADAEAGAEEKELENSNLLETSVNEDEKMLY